MRKPAVPTARHPGKPKRHRRSISFWLDPTHRDGGRRTGRRDELERLLADAPELAASLPPGFMETAEALRPTPARGQPAHEPDPGGRSAPRSPASTSSTALAALPLIDAAGAPPSSTSARAADCRRFPWPSPARSCAGCSSSRWRRRRRRSAVSWPSCGLPASTLPTERAETIGADPAHRGQHDLVTARACAPLPVLVELAMPLLRPGGKLLAWKGPLLPTDEEVRRGASAAGQLGGGSPQLEPSGGGRPWRPPLRGHSQGAAPRPTAFRAGRVWPSAGRSPEPAPPRAGASATRGYTRQSMRLAVLSDIHANLAALDAVRDDIPDVDETWVLGDIVGYGPQPSEVIAALQEMGARSVMGNHDGAAIGTVDTAWFNPDAARAIAWTGEVIDDNARAYLAALPEMRRDGDLTAVHGSPRDPTWEYITGPTSRRPTWPASRRGSACTGTPTSRSSSRPMAATSRLVAATPGAPI